MRLFTPPKTDYVDHYDQARFNLVWYLSAVFTGFIIILVILNLSNRNYAPLSYILACGVSTGSLIALKIFRKYEIVSRAISISGLGILTYTFLGLSNVVQYTTPLWVMINILFSYFTCGRMWGSIILILHFIVFGLFFEFKFQDNLANLPSYTDFDVFYFIVEYSLAGVLIAYFLHMFVTTTYYAERKFRLSNTRLNTKNEVISKQNEEKEVMLKEIHHRVKNNLQVITSLLRLQSYEIEGEENTTKFNEAISRVKAMALIHEKMYQKDMLKNFDLKSYIHSLSTDLLETYSLEKVVNIEVNSDMSEVGSRTIVPLALMFNELISNSLKHAFNDINKPSITINLCQQPDGYFELDYRDNGTWKEGKGASFGQELITTMTEQLDGNVQLNKTSEGTNYKFVLKSLSERYDERNRLG